MIEARSYFGWGTGAVPHERDDRDYCLAKIPRVARALPTTDAPLPDSSSMQSLVRSVYNQGATPACVAYSTAAMKAVHEIRELNRWIDFDAMACYRECGGDGRNGVPTRTVLEYVQERGMPVLYTSERYRIGSYAFAPEESPEVWVDALKAAVAAAQPCVIAALLPSSFGWESFGNPTAAYHQMLLVGYDQEHAILLNSWGKEWGRDGFGRLHWGYLTADGFQHGACYAYTAIDAIDESLKPTPAPPADRDRLTVTVSHSIRPATGTCAPSLLVYANVTDDTGQPVDAICQLLIGNDRYGSRAVRNGSTAGWQLLKVPAPGEVVRVEASTDAGAMGDASFVIGDERP